MPKFSINSSILTKIFFIIFVPFLLSGYSWSGSADAPVTATFYDDNNNVVADIQGEQGSSIIVPTAPVKSGYTFTHWQEVGGSETIANGVAYYTLTRGIEFKAQYAPIIYTVTFLGYDDDIFAQINATAGTSIQVPSAPDRTGYTFTHWKEMGGSETIASGVSNYTVAKSIVFKAQYVAIVHTVTFLDYDDDIVAQINATQGSLINVPNATDRTGYTFTQWKDVVGNETIASGVTTYTVTKDIIFKAQYTVVSEYTIIFLDDNDTVVAEINATAGTSIQVPDAPSIPNYTFTSWIEVGGTERISSGETHYAVTRDVTFKAQYSAITYTAIFLNEGGVVEANLSGTYGSYITVPNAPPKSGYTFTQWKEDGGTVTIPSGTATYTIVRDITFKPEYVEGVEIRTQADLDNVRNNMAGKYMLMNNIALSDSGAGYDSSGWQPIGTQSNPFKGTFDGNGHKITGLWMDRGSTKDVGLFGWTQGATIKNLGVEIGGRGVKGKDAVGGIVGSMHSSDSITNSYSTGSVSGISWVGGIAGYLYGSCSITNSYSTGSVSGGVVGGIVGYMYSSSITNSYSTGSVSGSSQVGGIAGYVRISSSITNSYSTGSVSGSGSYVGGIAGAMASGSITNNAAINPSVSGGSDANRIVGYIYSSTVSNNFALNTMTVTGTASYGNAGTSKTITDLTTQSTYSSGLGWNFGNDENNPWKIDPYKNNGLPYLYWENR
jgi:hypothetical protein